MQQLIINFEQSQPLKNTISFKKAQKLIKLAELKAKYDKDSETARYLQGKKKGSWGRITQADIKRSEKLTHLKFKIDQLEQSIQKIN